MRKLLLFLVLFPLGAVGQTFYQFNQPFPNAKFRVCPVPSGGNPCPSPVAIFSDSGLSQSITQPVTVGPDGNYGFWVAAGQYTIQLDKPYNLVYIISLGGGGGGGGSGTINSGTAPDIAFYPTTGTSVSADPDLTYQSLSHAHTFGVGGINLPGTSGQVTLKGTGTITSYTLLFPTSVVPGFWRTDGAGNITYTELSGDCTTSGSGAITCTKSSGTPFGSGAFISSTAGGDLSGTLPSPSVVGLHFGATAMPLGVAPSIGQCLEFNGTNITGAACSGGGGSVTTTGTPANGNLTQFSGATTITNGNLSGDVTTSGTLTTSVVGLHFGATGLSLGTAPTSGQCLEYNGTNITGAACAGGGGTINAATQFSAAYYSAAGSATTISGVAAPTAPSNVPLFFTSTNSGGVAQSPGWTLAGIPGRTVTVSTDSIQGTDRTAWVVYNSSSAVATSLSQAGTAGFDNFFAFGVKNIGTAAVTITPTTSTIDGNTALVVPQGQNCTIATLDNTNYVSRCASGQITAGPNITVTPSANGIQISTSAGGGFTGGTVTGDTFFTSGRPWVDVVGKGADPTGVADSLAAFESAMNAACAMANGPGTVFIPAGTYTFSAGIPNTLFSAGSGFWCNGLTILGQGRQATTLNFPTGTGYAISVADNIRNLAIGGFLMQVGGGSGGSNNSIGGIKWGNNLFSVTLKDVYIIGPITSTQAGISTCVTPQTTCVANETLFDFERVRVDYFGGTGGVGFEFQVSSTADQLTCHQCYATGDTTNKGYNGIHINGWYDATLIDSSVDNMSHEGFYLSTGANNAITGIGLTAESNTGNAFFLNGSGTVVLINARVQSQLSASSAIFPFEVSSMTGNLVLNNLFSNNTNATATASLDISGTAPASAKFIGNTAQLDKGLSAGALSNLQVMTTVTGTPTTGDLTSFAGGSALGDSGLVAANVATSASNAGAAKQVAVSGGANKTLNFIDFPEVLIIPAANCNNTTAGAGWSIGSGGTVTCRAGTNNKGGFISITDTSTTFAQFSIVLPEDWDTASNPFIRFQVASTDTTSGHTIIPSIQVSCSKGDGTTTDDVTFNAAHSLSTVTTNVTANQFWSTSNVQMNSTDMTGCVAGALMTVQVGRATDTSTNAEFYSATITIPRLLVVQAN